MIVNYYSIDDFCIDHISIMVNGVINNINDKNEERPFQSESIGNSKVLAWGGNGIV